MKTGDIALQMAITVNCGDKVAAAGWLAGFLTGMDLLVARPVLAAKIRAGTRHLVPPVPKTALDEVEKAFKEAK